MIKIFATDKVKELDQYTIQHEPISSIDLVERAATTFVHEFCRRYSKQVRIVIFAGQGNNGADALAIARLLNEESYRVETYLFNPTEHLSVECEQNKQRLLDMERIEFTEVVRDFEPPTLTDRFGIKPSSHRRFRRYGQLYQPIRGGSRSDRYSFRLIRGR